MGCYGEVNSCDFWPKAASIFENVHLILGLHFRKTSSKISKIVVYYQNVRGLRTKLNDFSIAVTAKYDYDILLLTETNLFDGIRDVAITMLSSLYRKCVCNNILSIS